MTLLNCPFCGSETHIKVCGVYTKKAVRVLCTRCHIGTAPVTEGPCHNYFSGETKIITHEQAQAEAVTLWNTRAGGVTASA